VTSRLGTKMARRGVLTHRSSATEGVSGPNRTHGSLRSRITEVAHEEAEEAVRTVVEGYCPLCQVKLVVHADHADCGCCGDAYRVEDGRLEIHRCRVQPDCEHWDAVWRSGRAFEGRGPGENRTHR
jgi:hypothetical protein